MLRVGVGSPYQLINFDEIVESRGTYMKFMGGYVRVGEWGEGIEGNPYYLFNFDEIVDVEEVGPPGVLTVVSVWDGRGPHRPLTPVPAQAQIHHDHQHVDRGQSESTIMDRLRHRYTIITSMYTGVSLNQQ